MCGRFTLHHTAEEIAARFEIQEVLFDVQPRYNIAPSQPIATITQQDGARVLGSSRWGLIPSWAKDAAIGNRMINARAETLRSCTIITTVPNEIITPLHHRMAVILKPEDEETWLDPDLKDVDELSQLLQPYANDALELFSVSRRVNTPAFDEESCIFPWQEDLEEAIVEASVQPKLF